MFGPQMGKSAAHLMGNTIDAVKDEDGHHQLEKQFAKVVQMVTNKSTEYDLEVPVNITDAIKEVEEASKPQKKAKVN